ncbi:hypothetical protein GCM10023169_10690 [Georgenia halophila]|uniref:Putative Flp pilus-assembly TadG-like N-terminal domain-containing protein n=1 Tax=Georgenia halophila TaxID=620889 RepID=A0ABP8KZD1_9MICO
MSRDDGGTDASVERDRGSGTVLGLTLVAVLIIMTLAVVGLSKAVHARGAAQSGADLAALAAATALHAAGGQARDPCRVADEVAAANGTELTACRVIDENVEVTTGVVVIGETWPLEGRRLEAHAEARAGPAG